MVVKAHQTLPQERTVHLKTAKETMQTEAQREKLTRQNKTKITGNCDYSIKQSKICVSWIPKKTQKNVQRNSQNFSTGFEL